jgi:hypothetical protein
MNVDPGFLIVGVFALIGALICLSFAAAVFRS